MASDAENKRTCDTRRPEGHQVPRVAIVHATGFQRTGRVETPFSLKIRQGEKLAFELGDGTYKQYN